jgi:serine/threonine protein kinase
VPAYEVLEKIGEGGMGVVYKARQLGLGRLVALKMIKAGAGSNAEQLHRFRIEAEAVARLQHPNIVQIHEIGEYEGMPYFSLEFCAGGSLSKALEGKPQPPQPSAAVVEMLARAMHATHERNIIHRDLKPANVLLAPASGGGGLSFGVREPPAEPGAKWTPKLTDFGLAKKLDAEGQTVEGCVMGTPNYMAPEQALGKTDLGPGCDVYALGANLYECLTGRPLVVGFNVPQMLYQVLYKEPVPPGQLVDRCPRDLETICLKCLQKDRAKRYATALDLADDLRRYRANEPIKARPVGRLERGWRCGPSFSADTLPSRGTQALSPAWR